MRFHVGRNGQQLGEFTEEEIRLGLAQGRFQHPDLVWKDGMPEWKPLAEVFGFAAAAALSAPMAADGGMVAALPIQGPPGYAHVGVGVMPTSGLAIASLVLGVIALLSFFACFFGAVLGVPGAICGHMALSSIRLSGNQIQGKGMAIAGLCTSYASLGIALILVLVVVLVFGVAAVAGAAGK